MTPLNTGDDMFPIQCSDMPYMPYVSSHLLWSSLVSVTVIPKTGTLKLVSYTRDDDELPSVRFKCTVDRKSTTGTIAFPMLRGWHIQFCIQKTNSVAIYFINRKETISMKVQHEHNGETFKDEVAYWVEHNLTLKQGDPLDKLIRLVTRLTSAHLEQNPNDVKDVAADIGCDHTNHRIVNEVE